MDSYDPGTVFSSIDAMGRYAFANQPKIALWNLARLAECLVPLLSDDQTRAIADAEAALGKFSAEIDRAYHAGMRRKLGLFTADDNDPALIKVLLDAMTANQADFTLTFRKLGEAAGDPAKDESVRRLFADPDGFDAWAVLWRERLAPEPQDGATRQAAMAAVNPAFIPRNHRIQAVIEAAVDRDDFAPFEELLAVLAAPFDDQPAFARYADPPEPHERVLETFCGT
jgi:uncharacterized protein YdiU (UPF0061 family)